MLLRQDFYGLAWAIDLTRSAHYAVFFIHDFRPSRFLDAENRQRTYFHTQFVNVAKTLCVIHDYSNHGFCLRWISFQMLLSISRTVLALHVQASSQRRVLRGILLALRRYCCLGCERYNLCRTCRIPGSLCYSRSETSIFSA